MNPQLTSIIQLAHACMCTVNSVVTVAHVSHRSSGLLVCSQVLVPLTCLNAHMTDNASSLWTAVKNPNSYHVLIKLHWFRSFYITDRDDEVRIFPGIIVDFEVQ